MECGEPDEEPDEEIADAEDQGRDAAARQRVSTRKLAASLGVSQSTASDMESAWSGQDCRGRCPTT